LTTTAAAVYAARTLRHDSLWLFGLAVPLTVAAVTVAVGDYPAEQFDEGGVGTWAFLVGFLRARDYARRI